MTGFNVDERDRLNLTRSASRPLEEIPS